MTEAELDVKWLGRINLSYSIGVCVGWFSMRHDLQMFAIMPTLFTALLAFMIWIRSRGEKG